MIETDKFYSVKYCKRVDEKKWRHRNTPKAMTVIYDFFSPESVIDVGCANGLHLKALKELGCKNLYGIEGTRYWAPYIEKYFGTDYIIADLRKPLPDLGRFDLVMCLEVLEHLEEDSALQAARNLVNLGDTLCITACPSFGGFYHLNPKPKKYWIEMFESLGVTYCPDEVEQLQTVFSKGRCSLWFKNNLKVFKNGIK